jgi:hypothetical protein
MKRVAIVLAALALAGCSFVFERAEGLNPGDIDGRAVIEGEPAPFARVKVAGASRLVRADREGDFRVAGLPAGTWVLRVDDDKNGDGLPERATVRAVQIRAQAGEPAFLLLGDVELNPVAQLRGRVVRDGAAVPGARVFVSRNLEPEGAQDPSSLGAEAETATDDEGRFRFPALAEGDVLVSVIFAEGQSLFGAEELEIALAPGDDLDAGDIDLELVDPTDRQVGLTLTDLGGATELKSLAVAPGAAPDEQALFDFNAGEVDPAQDILNRSLRIGPHDVYVASDDGRVALFENQFATVPGPVIQLLGVSSLGEVCFRQDFRDCDTDAFRSLPPLADPNDPDDPNMSIWSACADQCFDAFGNAAETQSCEVDGEVFDCDDDGDGQPDMTEPFRCTFPTAGNDADGDGLCEREDPFPQCAENDPAAAACGADRPDVFTPPGVLPIYDGIAPPRGDAGVPDDAGAPVDAGGLDAGGLDDAGVDAGPPGLDFPTESILLRGVGDNPILDATRAADGAIIVAGLENGSDERLELGDCPKFDFDDANPGDVLPYLARINPDGSCGYLNLVTAPTAPSTDFALIRSLDVNGDIVCAVGNFSQTQDFGLDEGGSPNVIAAGSNFVARYRASTGALLNIVAGTGGSFNGVQTLDDGGCVATSRVTSTQDIGGRNIDTGGAVATTLARFDTALTATFLVNTFVDDFVDLVQIPGDDDVIVAGQLEFSRWDGAGNIVSGGTTDIRLQDIDITPDGTTVFFAGTEQGFTDSNIVGFDQNNASTPITSINEVVLARMDLATGAVTGLAAVTNSAVAKFETRVAGLDATTLFYASNDDGGDTPVPGGTASDPATHTDVNEKVYVVALDWPAGGAPAQRWTRVAATDGVNTTQTLLAEDVDHAWLAGSQRGTARYDGIIGRSMILRDAPLLWRAARVGEGSPGPSVVRGGNPVCTAGTVLTSADVEVIEENEPFFFFILGDALNTASSPVEDLVDPAGAPVALVGDELLADLGIRVSAPGGVVADDDFGTGTDFGGAGQLFLAPGPAAATGDPAGSGESRLTFTFEDPCGNPAGTSGFGFYLFARDFTDLAAPAGVELYDVNDDLITFLDAAGRPSFDFFGVRTLGPHGAHVPAIYRVVVITGPGWPGVLAHSGGVIEEPTLDFPGD